MQIILGDLLTGRRIMWVPYVDASWSVELNGAGSVTCTVSLPDEDVQALDLRNTATLGKSFMGAVVDGVVVECGPLWSRSYDREAGTLKLEARGLWSYFDRRTVLPNLGERPVIDPGTGMPAGYTDTTVSGAHLGTIGKRLVQQSLGWPGANLPVVFESDKAGNHTRTYVGAELPIVGEVLSDLTGVEGGPDIEFMPRWSADRMGVEWSYRSGDPRITSDSVYLVDDSVPGSPVVEMPVTESAARMGSLGWCAAGRSADIALVERVLNPALGAAGFPLMEVVDSSRSSVKLASTARAYAAELARNGAKPVAQWGLVLSVGGDGEPRFADFHVGDFVDVKISGDLFLVDGVYRRRIVNMSGGTDSSQVKLGLGEMYG